MTAKVGDRWGRPNNTSNIYTVKRGLFRKVNFLENLENLEILEIVLVDVSDIFYFFCSGRGKGESEVPGGVGDRFFIENPRRGGGGGSGWEGPRGREGVCTGELGGDFWGGGVKYFFSGPKCPPRCREPPDCGKQRKVQPFSRDSRDPPVKRPLS